jgi:hypothetical protein
MKLYFIDFNRGQQDWQRIWVGTQTEAKKMQKHLEVVHGRNNVESFSGHEVPTDKSGLLTFLNVHANIALETEAAEDIS